MSTLFNTSEIHVELSSKCTLKCPRCPRTELKPEQLNQEISLQEFQQAFSPAMLSQVNRFVFCGDIGDPIYAKDLIPIVKYIKSKHRPSVSIVTNGSYKSTEWWQELGGVLGPHDKVTFSVDGWDDASNNLYRVNSNWSSITAGIRALRASSGCKIIWSAIYFNFNEQHMQKMSDCAAELGADEFVSVRSTKFGYQYFTNGVDTLIPSKENVAKGGVYDKQTMYLTKPLSVDIRLRNHARHEWAKCLRWDKELFINVNGLVFPCPWFNSGYQTNDFVQKYADRMSIKTRPLDDILNDPMWEEFITRLELMPLDVCKLKCKGPNNE